MLLKFNLSPFEQELINEQFLASSFCSALGASPRAVSCWLVKVVVNDFLKSARGQRLLMELYLWDRLADLQVLDVYERSEDVVIKLAGMAALVDLEDVTNRELLLSRLVRESLIDLINSP